MESWQKFLTQLEEELGSTAVKQWVPKLLRFDAANLYLAEPDSFQRAYFEEHIRPRLKGLLNNNGRPIKVHFDEKLKTPIKKEEEIDFAIKGNPLDPEMTFENFVPQEQNLVVYKLLTELPPFNPIYIYGPQGSGKTHLLMATANRALSQGKKVFFVKAETFTEHVVQAIRLGQMQTFRQVYRDIDMLIIDDIDIFSKKLATQEEFFHTFNTLHTSGRLVLLSANVAPTSLNEVEERLISRFEWGISLDIGKIDPLLILEKKAALWQIKTDKVLFSYLLEHFPSNPLLAFQALVLRAKGAPLTPLLAQTLLKDMLAKEKEGALTPEEIIKTVASHYGVRSEDLLGKSQMREFVLPRQVAMYYCREKLKLAYQKIGALFGKDHSTVMSSIKQAQEKGPPQLY
jgi:chromosomal replication initiator protein